MIEQNFVRKKVKSLTLGEKLRQLREERHMRVYDLSHKINVKSAYIEALEKGQYNQLPTKVYVKGFVRSYARFFGVTEHVLINLFEREYSVYNNINNKEEEETVNKLPQVPRFVFTPRILMVGVGFVFLLAIGIYLYFGIDNFVSSPWIIVEQPMQNSIVTEDFVIIQGKTRNNSRVFINGQQTFVNMDGSFSEKVGLSFGINVIQVKSINKFDKESVTDIVVDAQYVIEQPTEEKKDEMSVFVRTTRENILVYITADDVSVYNDMIDASDTREFHFTREVKLTTSNGSETMVSCDGEKYIKLSNDSGVIKDHVFDKEHMCETLIEVENKEKK